MRYEQEIKQDTPVPSMLSEQEKEIMIKHQKSITVKGEGE